MTTRDAATLPDTLRPAPAPTNVSPLGLALIEKWEGLARWVGGILRVYLDVAGKMTIGVGHLVLPGEDFSAGITERRALELLAHDVGKVEAAIRGAIHVPLTAHQFDALASWAFNCGTGVLYVSTLVRELNAGNYDDVPRLLTAWCKRSDPKTRKMVDDEGLLNRRRSEGGLWSTLDVASDVGDTALPSDTPIPELTAAEIAHLESLQFDLGEGVYDDYLVMRREAFDAHLEATAA